MKIIWPIVFAFLCLVPTGCFQQESSMEPKSILPQKIPGLIRSLPKYTRFGFSGLSFFKGHLYASSNLGLLVISGEKIEALYQWPPTKDTVVEGPWNDLANNAIWIQLASNGSLIRFDGTNWHHIQLPRPPTGEYTRGDILKGFIGISAPQAFWVVGGGNAWRWESTKVGWKPESQPLAPEWSVTRAVAPFEDSLLYVVCEGLEVTPPSPYAIYVRKGSWRKIPLQKMDFEDVVVTTKSVYIRAADGTLFSINDSSKTILDTPGECEAITRTSAGGLLASFKNIGIYLLSDADWELKASYPYEPTEGEHWAHIAEDGGRIAYATTSVPHLSGEDGNWSFSGTVALWVLLGSKLSKVLIQ